ncbi:MAG: hypothetical protein COV07_03970 [Candidatus Vogelbacteria bacterium CG10_big_fil_rev_8_21_14_0_10_45_14]|uniref:RecF/RecN/SMC N-terminal domain-containing protein n=1 Tax=Candidatus Vogelbacteria bacterium CG10_big_fil_rev_8_21_14_0_10_45_14 TaxID=1975042 RepID=A0A2H0RJ77_9BACT|nr:MAG: hypothetical protein COV07_03970 [Candidatus Vogelbacteria bacterium CG10_big_fil_rev_8_21_14_0_10_45_14]
MLLKRLMLQGFKSFAKKTVFEFDTNVTAIVGPNGSGKSNTAEALRWVLGEQSLTTIRGRRGEDFIFAGTPGVSRLNTASVSVVFENSARQFSIDFDEVELTRDVHRDGENIYRLNGTKVRLRDIIELLSSVSLGASAHHVVSQGEADRLLSANLEERRDMIEDALGIKIYEYKRTEAKRKLEKTEVHAKEVESLRREIAPHLRFLEKQVEQAKRAESLKSELLLLYGTYLADERAYVEDRSEAIASRTELARNKREEIERAISDLGKLREDVPRNAIMAKISERDVLLHSTRERETEEIRKLGKIEGALEGKKEEKERLKESTEEDEDNGATVPITSVAAFVGELEGVAEVALVSSDAESARGALQSILVSIRSFLDRCRGLKVEKSENREHVIESEIQELEREVGSGRAKLELFLRERGGYEHEIIVLRAELDSLVSKTRDAEREHYELDKKRSEILNEERMISLEMSQIVSMKEDLKREETEAAVLVGRAVLNNEGSDIQPSREEQMGKRKKIERLKIRIEEIGGGGEEVLREYEETKERDLFLQKELVDLRETSQKLLSIMEDLGNQIDAEFKTGVARINLEFSKYFALLFDGGGAKLTIVRPRKRHVVSLENSGEIVEDNEDVAREGLDIEISIPRKKVRSLEALSGGERTLVSIALLFATVAVKPPPFLVLDETDAALDEANSKKYGDMLETIASDTQLILVTHNRETMSHAGALYGVTLGQDGVSRVLSVKFEEAEQMAAR